MKNIFKALVLLGSFLSCGGAFAHAHLAATIPEDGATIASVPVALSLTFTEPLEFKLSGVTLKGPGATTVAIGVMSLSADAEVMRIPLPNGLGAGSYTVDWHAFSIDGHTTHGSYRFMVVR